MKDLSLGLFEREILRSLELPQDDLIHQNTIHIIHVHLLRRPAQRNVGLRMTNAFAKALFQFERFRL